MSGENGKSKAPFRVPQAATFQEQLVGVHRQALPIGADKIAVELVQELVRLLTFDFHTGKFDKKIFLSQFTGLHVLLNLKTGLFLLQVGLTVQVFGLNIGNALRQRAFYQDQIAGEVLILFDLDQTTYLELARAHRGNFIASTERSFALLIVLGPVLAMATEIFNDVFDHGDSNDNRERDGRQYTSILLPDAWDELQKDQEEEVRVRQFGELKVQVLRQEGKKRVLARGHHIRHEFTMTVSFLEYRVQFEYTTILH